MTEPTVAEIARKLTKARKNALVAMGQVWLTVSEMKPLATGSGCDVLYTMHLINPLCERRWAKWGGEPKQKRGEGYEYRLTSLGLAVRAHLQEKAR